MAVKLGMGTQCFSANEFGVCRGSRTCTPEGLTPCSAPQPGFEECDGEDNDCDDQVDEGTCEDDNSCTADACEPDSGGCSHVVLEGICDDGSVCTQGDSCVNGQCYGEPTVCADSNQCTEDKCDPEVGCMFVPAGGDCDDGDPCTVGDHCDQAVCVGVPAGCACTENEDCDALDDGNQCNGVLYCNMDAVPFTCAVDPETLVACPPPSGPNAACLVSQCNSETGACENIPLLDGLPCEDGNLCTAPDMCAADVCTPGPILNCNDGGPCTDDACSPEEGCVHTPNNGPCNDGDICTVQDQCANGDCIERPFRATTETPVLPTASIPSSAASTATISNCVTMATLAPPGIAAPAAGALAPGC